MSLYFGKEKYQTKFFTSNLRYLTITIYTCTVFASTLIALSIFTTRAVARTVFMIFHHLTNFKVHTVDVKRLKKMHLFSKITNLWILKIIEH